MRSIDKTYRRVAILLLVAGIATVLFAVDPAGAWWAPKCPFYLLTGCQCPACGTQRAIHHLLRLEWAQAFGYNPFLLISFPYLAALVGLRWFDPAGKWRRLRNFCYDRRVILTYWTLLMIWWIVRNVWHRWG